MKKNKTTGSEKILSFSTMAAGMAHEIKNPLSSIKVLTQLMSRKFDDPDYRAKFMDIMPREISRIDRIIEGLLSYARSHAPEMEPQSVNELISDAVSHLRDTGMTGGADIIIEAGELEMIMADRQQLTQVFHNIILNGIQSLEGGGTVKITTEKDRRSSKIGRSGIIVTICDTGTGISREDMARIYDPFFSTKHSGTGLGLTIAHGIIEKHNGTIEAESTGNGTCFRICLPVRRRGK